MRKLVTLATLVALVATMVVPAAALAKGGPPAGKGPGFTPPGQAKKAAPPADQAVTAEVQESEGNESPSDSKSAAKEERKAEKSAAKDERKAEKAAAKAGKDDGEPGDEAFASAAVGTAEETPTIDPDNGNGNGENGNGDTDNGDEADEPSETGKQRGIANALSRIAANIERAEARVEAGNQSRVPPGLLKVLSKFMSWLGIEADPDPDYGAPDVPENGDPGENGDDGNEGSEEGTSTPDPVNGSEEDTGTVEPEFEE